MRRASLVLAACLAAGCGDASVRLSQSVNDDVRQRLLSAADRAAEANDGEARHVEAVKTTRAKAADVTGYGGGAGGDQEVWVIEVSGTSYSCTFCHHPPGVQPDWSHMRFITLVLSASDYTTSDAGLSPRSTDIDQYGEVEVLRS